MAADVLAEFDEALDEESWEWLTLNNPDIAKKLEKAVKAGATPDQLFNQTLKRIGSHRKDFATRCYIAARYLRRKLEPQ